MGDIFDKIIWLIVGGTVTICVQRILAHLNEKRSQFRIYRLAFKGFPDFHKQLFFKGLTTDIWERHIPMHLRDHCITFVFFLESIGRAVAKDVRWTVHAINGSGIAAHMFLVEKTAICGRLETKKKEDKELIATWKYINPGDEIELHLLVAGIDNPNDVEIGIDGEGIEVTERVLLQKSIQAIMCTGQIPILESSTELEAKDKQS